MKHTYILSKKFKYSQESISLIRTMNSLNVLSTAYVIIKYPTDFTTYLPHGMVCLSSVVFWRDPKDQVIKALDYLCVINSLVNTWFWSYEKECEMFTTTSIMMVTFLYCMSMHYKNIGNEKKCVLYHCLTYLVANIGIIGTFS